MNDTLEIWKFKLMLSLCEAECGKLPKVLNPSLYVQLFICVNSTCDKHFTDFSTERALSWTGQSQDLLANGHLVGQS